ncbi:hypothetical protein ABGI61_01845 [Rheinheimera sp. FR7-31]|uniref:hypothetical protein n=1 Tax=Rheinheimera fenheensis TaxID=3152295 RepID=UPI00325E7065
MSRKFIITFVIFQALVVPISSTEAQQHQTPEILSYLPRCEYTVLQTVDISEISSTAVREQSDIEQELKQRLVTRLRTDAQAHSANAVIVKSVDKEHITHNPFIGQQNHKNRLLKIKVNADLIAACTEDASKPQQQAPYNDKLERVIGQQRFELKPIIIQSPTISNSSAASQPEVSIGISAEQGFYGAKPGMSYDELISLFGAPSGQFSFDNGVRALAFGKSVWCFFQHDKLIAIKHHTDYLTPAAIRLLPEDSRFDKQEWQLDQRFGPRSLLSELKEHYDTKLHKVNPNRYQIVWQQQLLQLDFTVYNSLNSDDVDARLVALSLTTADLKQPELKLQLVEPPAIQVALNAIADSMTNTSWYSAVSELPVLHQIYNGKVSEVIYDNIFSIQFADGKPVAVRLQPLIRSAAGREKITSYLRLLKQPVNVEQFLQRYPDTFEMADKLDVFSEHFDLTATIDEENSGNLDSIYIEFHH